MPDLPKQNWQDVLSSISVLQCREDVGVVHELEVDIFGVLCFTDEMMKEFVKQINLYASQLEENQADQKGCVGE